MLECGLLSEKRIEFDLPVVLDVFREDEIIVEEASCLFQKQLF